MRVRSSCWYGLPLVSRTLGQGDLIENHGAKFPSFNQL